MRYQMLGCAQEILGVGVSLCWKNGLWVNDYAGGEEETREGAGLVTDNIYDSRNSTIPLQT